TLRVLRLTPDGFNFQTNELGETAYRARFNQKVEPYTEFSEPAYGYLLAFNPTEKRDDVEQIIPRRSGDVPPAKAKELAPGIRFTLNDGEGLQAFAVVASHQPLPAYAEWRKRQLPSPWRRTKALSGVVLRFDGKITREVFGEAVTRGAEEPSDRTAFESLA